MTLWIDVNVTRAVIPVKLALNECWFKLFFAYLLRCVCACMLYVCMYVEINAIKCIRITLIYYEILRYLHRLLGQIFRFDVWSQCMKNKSNTSTVVYDCNLVCIFNVFLFIRKIRLDLLFFMGSLIAFSYRYIFHQMMWIMI